VESEGYEEKYRAVIGIPPGKTILSVGF
jgi:hypothetical protein